MGSPSYRMSSAARAGSLAALGVAYVCTGVFGLHIAGLANAVTLVWPPTGFAIAGAIVFGRRAIPVVVVSSIVVSYIATSSLGFATATGIGNSLEAWIAAWLFERWAEGRRELARPADAGAYAFAASLACLVAAAIGTLGLLAFVHPAPSLDFATAFGTWWLGDMVGALLVGPACLSLASPVPGSVSRAKDPRTGIVVAGLGVATIALHFIRYSLPTLAYPLVLVQLVVIVAATFRFGSRGAHLAAFSIAAAAVIGTVEGRGPYAALAPGHEFVALWAGLALAAGSALFVSSLAAERTSAERRLVVSEERLRALFEKAPDGMLLLDADRRVVLANPAALAMARRSGFSDGDALQLLVGDETGELRAALKRGLARGERIVEASMKQSDPDGSVREFVVRTTMIGAPRRFDGAVVLVEDVTLREAARREREGIDQQLAAAQRLDSIGNLAGGIAHDFNNMLQAIQANAELAQLAVQRGKDPSPTIDRVLAAAERAASLTRQLLAFSRRQPASFDRVDVVATLRSALALFERLVPENIHLIFDPRVAELAIRGDQAQLEQVVLNLVVNARDAMPQGGTLRIEVDAERFEETGGGLVRLTVSDEGPGVDSAIRDRIFEPFFTTKPTGRGTGLGLAVVYGIVKSHGGSVYVENVSPRGARFVVELPWLEGPAAPAARGGDTEIPLGQGQSVLLVEDDAMVRTAVRDMLAASGYVVSIASHGADAVAAYVDSGGEFDVVILDIVMPTMGGREAYERLVVYDPQVRVLFATGYSEEQIDVGFVLRERVPVLTKPYDRASLLRTVAEVLDGSHS